jgi:positive regulator of sigma E activity
MKEEARVLELTDGGMAKLEVVRSDACKTCNACFEGGSGKRLIFAENSLGAKEGDRVTIEISSAVIAKLSFLIYLLPITGLLLGVALVAQITVSEIMRALGGIAGFTVFSSAVFVYLRKTKPKQSYMTRITKIFNQPTT